MEETKKEKTIYDLKLHEMISVPTEVGGKIEITRVPGGWVYAFEYAGFRQSPIVFIPFKPENEIEIMSQTSKKP
jgi:hypothetical protein